MPGHRMGLAVILALLTLPLVGDQPPLPGLEPYRQQAEALTRALEQQRDQPPPEVQEALESVRRTLDTEAWQQQQRTHQQQLWRQTHPDGPSLAEVQAASDVDPDTYPLLFISASIPLATLRQYVRPLAQASGKLVLRGAIGGLERLAPTARFLQSVLRKDPDCRAADCALYTLEVLIDPLLFRDYQIQQVPALVMHTGTVQHCDPSGPTGERHVVYGDASLTGLIDTWHELAQGP